MICKKFKVVMFLFFKKEKKHLKPAVTIFQIFSDALVTIYIEREIP